jgi:hypothetical protein
MPVLYVVVHFEVVDFFSKGVVGWTFKEWIKEKLNKKGIVLPESAEWWLEHPIFTLRRGHTREELLALPKVMLP